MKEKKLFRKAKKIFNNNNELITGDTVWIDGKTIRVFAKWNRKKKKNEYTFKILEIIELDSTEKEAKTDLIINDIIKLLKERPKGDLSDIGNYIGMAVARHCFDDEKEYWAFEKEAFLGGFQHGWSLHDGTH